MLSQANLYSSAGVVIELSVVRRKLALRAWNLMVARIPSRAYFPWDVAK